MLIFLYFCLWKFVLISHKDWGSINLVFILFAFPLSGFGGQSWILWKAYCNLGLCFFISIHYDGIQPLLLHIGTNLAACLKHDELCKLLFLVLAWNSNIMMLSHFSLCCLYWFFAKVTPEIARQLNLPACSVNKTPSGEIFVKSDLQKVFCFHLRYRLKWPRIFNLLFFLFSELILNLLNGDFF